LAGRAELATDARFASANARSANIGALYALLDGIASERTTADWLATLEAAEIPCNPVNRLEDLLTDPHLQATGFFVRSEHPTEGPYLTMRPPVTLSDSPPTLRSPAPRLGEQ